LILLVRRDSRAYLVYLIVCAWVNSCVYIKESQENTTVLQSGIVMAKHWLESSIVRVSKRVPLSVEELEPVPDGRSVYTAVLEVR
jgi:hypothetical protein